MLRMKTLKGQRDLGCEANIEHGAFNRSPRTRGSPTALTPCFRLVTYQTAANHVTNGVRVFSKKDRAGGHRTLVPADVKDPTTARRPVGLPPYHHIQGDKPLRPPQPLQIPQASVLLREPLQELVPRWRVISTGHWIPLCISHPNILTRVELVDSPSSSLDRDLVASPNAASLHYRGIHADVSLVLLGGGAQDTRILG